MQIDARLGDARMLPQQRTQTLRIDAHAVDRTQAVDRAEILDAAILAQAAGDADPTHQATAGDLAAQPHRLHAAFGIDHAKRLARKRRCQHRFLSVEIEAGDGTAGLQPQPDPALRTPTCQTGVETGQTDHDKRRGSVDGIGG